MKRKVLMTASTYRHINSFHLPYLRELQRLGWETHVGCAGIPGDASYIDQGIELPFDTTLQLKSEILIAAAVLRTSARLIRNATRLAAL